TDQAAARLASDLGAGRVLDPGALPGAPAEIAVLAVPPAAVASVVAQAQRRQLATWDTRVARVKGLPLREAGTPRCDVRSYVGGSRMPGRERSGPAAARADLFAGQPWVICATHETSAECVAAVTGLARACGSQPVEMSAAEHDRSVALVSHVPHLVASAMAAQCADAPADALALAGPGLRDVTRIAASESGLWAEILTANSAAT